MLEEKWTTDMMAKRGKRGISEQIAKDPPYHV